MKITAARSDKIDESSDLFSWKRRPTTHASSSSLCGNALPRFIPIISGIAHKMSDDSLPVFPAQKRTLFSHWEPSFSPAFLARLKLRRSKAYGFHIRFSPDHARGLLDPQ